MDKARGGRIDTRTLIRVGCRLAGADTADRQVVGMMLINAAVAFVVPALTILFGATVAAINDAGVVEARIASFSIGAVALSVGITVAGIGAGALRPRRAALRGFGDSR